MSLSLLSHVVSAVGRDEVIPSPVNLKVYWETSIWIHWNGWLFLSIADGFLLPHRVVFKVLDDFVASSGTDPWTVEQRDSLDSVHWEFTG